MQHLDRLAPATRYRIPRLVAGWFVAAVGIVLTAMSIGPSLLGASLLLLSDDAVSAVLLFTAVFVVAALEFAVPAFVGMAIANARGWWPLWLVLAIVPIVVVWCIAPFFGSLGVFWGPR